MNKEIVKEFRKKFVGGYKQNGVASLDFLELENWIISKIEAHDKEIIEKIEGLENPYIEGEREYYGYEIAKKDVLIILTPNKQI